MTSGASTPSPTPSLERFLQAMDGEWRVERFSVDDSGKLRVHYRSMVHTDIMWSHNPLSEDLLDAPKVGMVGRVGFSWIRDVPVREGR